MFYFISFFDILICMVYFISLFFFFIFISFRFLFIYFICLFFLFYQLFYFYFLFTILIIIVVYIFTYHLSFTLTDFCDSSVSFHWQNKSIPTFYIIYLNTPFEKTTKDNQKSVTDVCLW